MAKKTVDPQVAALEALARALADPAPKVLLGSAAAPGFFTGSSQAAKAAANVCKERGWLEPTGEWMGRGASKKERYRLTAAGVHAVLESSETLQLLRGVGDGVRTQIELLKTLQAQLGQMVQRVGPLGEGIAALERRLQPPKLEEIRRQLAPAGAPPAATPQPPVTAWLDRVAPLVAQQRERDRFQPLTLPALFQQLRHDQPTLTFGQFHDGLRTLRDQGRIRLLPFTRALASIDDPRNALFLDGEVMYYADLP